jgi:hypothetical protein
MFRAITGLIKVIPELEVIIPAANPEKTVSEMILLLCRKNAEQYGCPGSLLDFHYHPRKNVYY